MDEKKQPQPQEPELRRPDEEVKDLDPEETESQDVQGGASLNYAKVVIEY